MREGVPVAASLEPFQAVRAPETREEESREREPEVVKEPVKPPEPETLVTVPPEDARQTPATEKQPWARSIPLAKVEVAPVPVTLRYVACMPPEKVEVERPETTRLVVEAVTKEAMVVEAYGNIEAAVVVAMR